MFANVHCCLSVSTEMYIAVCLRDSVSMYIIVHLCLSGGTEMYTAVYLEEINVYCCSFRDTEMYTVVYLGVQICTVVFLEVQK